ncbi:MAG: hypothetical protein WBA87_07265, partial [Microbacterium sp.]
MSALGIDARSGRTLLLTGYVALVGIGASYGIGAIAGYGLLIPLAAPFGLLCIAALIWLPPKVQLLAWAVLTAWLLAPTYLGHGDQEIAALVVIVLLCLLGRVDQEVSVSRARVLNGDATRDLRRGVGCVGTVDADRDGPFP